jgi:hypothetical protein
MCLRWIVGAVVVVGLLAGCATGETRGDKTHDCAPSRDVKARPSSSAELETWTHAGADGGSIAHVTIAAPDPSPCTMVRIGKVGYAALWPRDAVREPDGVRLDDHLYRFGESVELRGRQYDGGPTTTACVASNLWMVLGGS